MLKIFSLYLQKTGPKFEEGIFDENNLVYAVREETNGQCLITTIKSDAHHAVPSIPDKVLNNKLCCFVEYGCSRPLTLEPAKRLILDVISTAQRNHSEVLSPHIWMVPIPRMRLDDFAPELKVEIILHLPNPTLLARCSREWNNIINLPATKAKWLIGRYGLTHALFHAVRMGEPFINLFVVECLFAQKAHISRYFIQRLVLGFGKYDSRLIDLKLTHNMGNLDPDRKKSIQNKIRSPWASNLSFDVFSRILKEGHDRFDGNDIPVRGNDMESFYYLSAGPLVISQARTKLRENTKEIITLIQRYKFAPFPPRPKIRKHILEKKEGGGIGLKPNPEIESESRTANFDDYPPSDGYENVRQLNVIARAILIYPELVNVWKENGYHEIVNDVNDLVMQGSLLILYPPSPSEDWVKPGLEQVVVKLNSLILLGFELTDALIGDALILFEHRLKDIGETLIDAFAVVRDLSKSEIISICLTELLNPDRNLKRHDLLDYIINRIEKPEEEILTVFKKYEIIRSVNDYHEAFTKFNMDKEATKFSPDNPATNKSLHSFLQFTFTKYSPIVYRYTVVKFGAQSKAAKHLMKEVTSVRLAISFMADIPSQQVPSDLTSVRWPDSITIFNEYYKAKVPITPRFLILFEKCQSDSVIKCLFDGYLAKLFGFKVDYAPPRTVRVPVLSSVDPVAQRVSKKRKASIKEAKREKEELQQKWRDLIFETYRKVDNGKFKEFLQKLMPRIDRSVQEEEDSGGTVSKRVRSDEQH